MRYAFVTSEFPTIYSNKGGLATYTRRMARLLTESGYDVDVFVLGDGTPDHYVQESYKVHHVPFRGQSRLNKIRKFFAMFGCERYAARWHYRSAAMAMASAIESIHAKQPFDVVQSPDHFGLGSALKKVSGRLHVVRCSAAMELYMSSDGRRSAVADEQVLIEVKAVSSADLVIAPSTLVASYYKKKLARDVHVVRPPAYLEESPSNPPYWLPEKFLVHFASWLGHRKGSDLIAKALPEAIATAPDLTMLWFGSVPDGPAGDVVRGVSVKHVLRVDTIDKSTLFAILKKATAVVIPSQVDNLPNTLIECLLLNVPLIVSDGASQNECVSEGPGVRLVPLGDSKALAKAMIDGWNGDLGHPVDPWISTSHGVAFRPEEALRNHLEVIRNHVV